MPIHHIVLNIQNNLIVEKKMKIHFHWRLLQGRFSQNESDLFFNLNNKKKKQGVTGYGMKPQILCRIENYYM